ncbi:MAG: M50 family metallopeptidase [Acidimicrobiales bacterium]
MTQLRDPVYVGDELPPPLPSPSSPGGNLARLIVSVVLIVAIAIAAHETDLLVVIVAIIAMVMLHELGHFATAKWSGMKVTEYFLGFGPRLWSTRRGETEYGIKALPLGGYVKIIGMSNLEEVAPEDEPRAYRNQPFRKRVLVAVAGSAMHFLLAIILFFVIFVGYGVQQPGTVVVEGLTVWQGPTSPAQVAGVQPGDVIVSVDGKAVHNVDQVGDVTRNSVGKKVTLVVRHNGVDRTLTVVPTNGHNVILGGSPAVPASTKASGLIGVELEYPNVTERPLSAAGQSFTSLGDLMKDSVQVVWNRFSPAGIANLLDQVSNTQAAKQAANNGTRPESIYGAVRTATQGAQAGWGNFLLVFVEINVFIGMINLLPMLPLDGGHVAIAVYERIRSRRGRPYHADVAKLTPVVYAFVLVLAVIVISSLYLDIAHPIPNPFK